MQNQIPKKINKKDNYCLKFGKAVDILTKDFFSVYRNYRPTYSRMTNRIVKVKLAIELYREIMIILNRIKDDLKKLQILESEAKKKWRVGRISSKSELGKLMNLQFHFDDVLRVDIKSVFHWVFILDDVLEKNAFPKKITSFRNIFLVHFQEKVKQDLNVRRLTAGFSKSPQNGPYLIFIPFFGSKRFSGFAKLEKRIKQYIPELKTEKNPYEKVRLIWENLDKLPVILTSGNQKNPNHFLNQLSKYGSRSPYLLEIVDSLLNVWHNHVKKLIN